MIWSLMHYCLLLLLLLKSLQSCLTLWDPIDGSLPGSPPPSLRPWDSPGKNTGVICHFLLQCMKVKSESEDAQLCPTLSNSMGRSLPVSSIHGISQARVLEWSAIAFYIHIHIHIFIASTLHYICNVISVRMCVTCYLIPLVYLSTFVEISHTLNYRPF